MYADWKAVESQINGLVVQSRRAFAPETLLNARALIRYSHARYKTPEEIGEGYWPTIGFHWTELNPDPIEVEIHPDRFELYVLGAGRPAIRSFVSQPDGKVSADLLAALDLLVPSPQAR
jgi:hypothetical protein